MKKLDSLILKSFMPPFILAFFIALFVLVMQFLWKFIDDIVGKGLTMFDIGELLMYRSISLFPLALPIGVLLSGVMVFGNMSEKYELSSLKSAGVNLLRIMAPAVVLSSLIGLFSFYCNNTLNPQAVLKFQARLYDIRVQKPALSIVDNIFNEDFKGFSIRVGEKQPDNRGIKDVLIYDNSPRTKGKINLVSAKSGEMYYTDDNAYFVMELYDGEQYQEVNTSPGQKGLPFMRTRFKRWRKEFDMSDFELGQTDEELFKDHYMMLNVSQLAYEADTLMQKLEKTLTGNMYSFSGLVEHEANESKDTASVPEDMRRTEELRERYEREQNAKKNINVQSSPQNSSDIRDAKEYIKKNRKIQKFASVPIYKVLDRVKAARDDSKLDSNEKSRTYSEAKHLTSYYAANDIRNYGQKARQTAKTVSSNADRNQKIVDSIMLNWRRMKYELHSKFSLAFICIVFIFIGAPMGAIVRKGGYGYPLLIAIFFFTLYIILNIMCKKLSDTDSLHPVFAAWLPCIVLAPVGFYLTVKAMNDSKLLDVDRYIRPITILFKKSTLNEGTAAGLEG